jgi:hypothetical protein
MPRHGGHRTFVVLAAAVVAACSGDPSAIVDADGGDLDASATDAASAGLDAPEEASLPVDSGDDAPQMAADAGGDGPVTAKDAADTDGNVDAAVDAPAGDAGTGEAGADDGGASDAAQDATDAAALGPFGANCTTGADCASGICFVGGMRSFCSILCNNPGMASSDCPVPPTSGQCNSRGYCR